MIIDYQNHKSAYECYQCYLALKKHFSSSYDYFKYNGKVNASYDSFQKRNDKYYFYKLSNKKEYKNIILANMLAGNDYIGNIVHNEGHCVYILWRGRLESLSYNFTRDLYHLDEDFDSNFICEGGQHPKLLNLYHEGKVSLETMVILDDLVNFIPHWNKKINLQMIWNVVLFKMLKYKPFLHYDRAKMKKIVITAFGQNSKQNSYTGE